MLEEEELKILNFQGLLVDAGDKDYDRLLGMLKVILRRSEAVIQKKDRIFFSLFHKNKTLDQGVEGRQVLDISVFPQFTDAFMIGCVAADLC
jgi:hypothetical protein